ncbi:MAG: D-2-hydroxyacid dehydrogenase [Thermomicrobiales bacterium]
MVVGTHRVMITTPLEAEHVDRIRREAPAGVDVIYEPDLLPPTRYTADHNGIDDYHHTSEQAARWAELLATADILFDFPPGRLHPHEASPRVGWIQTTSAGVGRTVATMGIKPGELIITTASGVHVRPLAEFVMMALLMVVKEHDRLRNDQAAHRWVRFCSDELSGKVIAIVGPGKIGSEIIRISRCFDMRPVATARDCRPERAAELGVERLYRRDELHEMLGIADAIVLCAPHTPETENIMDRAAFNAVAPGAVFINIGRGPLVDEAALLEKLLDGTIRFAALDVFRTEPLPADSPFWDLPNVLINPHSASTSDRENGRITDIFLHNLRCYVEGRSSDMRNVLDIERMY